VPQLPETIAQARKAIERIAPELAQLFALDQLDLHWVLLVGMFRSVGWVVEVDGHPTCFLALEMLTPTTPPQIPILVAHEGAHLAHAACLGPIWATMQTLGDELFVEGVALRASAQLVPGYDAATYVWSGRATTWRGERLADWLRACDHAWPQVVARLLHQGLEATGSSALAPFFVVNHTPADLPELTGYFAGWRLVSTLAAGHALTELARWSPTQIQEHIAPVLNEDLAPATVPTGGRFP
jgi:hypothetical protein